MPLQKRYVYGKHASMYQSLRWNPLGCASPCHLGEAMHQPASANGAARQHEANQGYIRAFNHSDTSAGMLVKRVKLRST